MRFLVYLIIPFVFMGCASTQLELPPLPVIPVGVKVDQTCFVKVSYSKDLSAKSFSFVSQPSEPKHQTITPFDPAGLLKDIPNLEVVFTMVTYRDPVTNNFVAGAVLASCNRNLPDVELFDLMHEYRLYPAEEVHLRHLAQHRYSLPIFAIRQYSEDKDWKNVVVVVNELNPKTIQGNPPFTEIRRPKGTREWPKHTVFVAGIRENDAIRLNMIIERFR